MQSTDTPLQIVPRHRPDAPSTPSRVRVWMCILATADISVRYLANDLMGRGGLATADRLLRYWSAAIMRIGNFEISTTGQSVFDQPQAYVIMSNHSSVLDIPVLILTVPHTLRMVTKEELMRIPIWGRAMLGSGFIPINRGNPTRAIAQLKVAKELLATGVSVWISPEGTRSRDGRLKPFKKGGFHLAFDLGVPILPVWIQGTFDAMPPDAFLAHTGSAMSVHFGAPISTQGLGPSDIPSMMIEVERAIQALRPSHPGASSTPSTGS